MDASRFQLRVERLLKLGGDEGHEVEQQEAGGEQPPGPEPPPGTRRTGYLQERDGSQEK